MISHRPTLPIHEHAWPIHDFLQTVIPDNRRTEHRRSKGGILFRHS